MKSNITEERLKLYGKIPSIWNGRVGYSYLGQDELYADGWRDVVEPEIADFQKLGNLYFDEKNDVVTYEVIEKTQEEIESEILRNAEQKQVASIQSLMQQKLQGELQSEDDNEAILDNKDAYPIWTASGELIKLGTKLQAFNTDGELSIFRCNQDILATQQYEPRLAVYAFDEIKMGGEYPIWVQPHAHNPYMKDDIVWYPSEGADLYISTVDNNTHAPLVVAGAWEIYVK